MEPNNEPAVTRDDAPPPVVPAREGLGAWWWQGLRSAFLMRPRWEGLHLTPVRMAVLVVVPVLLLIAIEWLYVEGAARFHWEAIGSGWLASMLLLWTCWAVVQGGRDRPTMEGRPRDGASLFAMLWAQLPALLVLPTGIAYPLWRSGAFEASDATRYTLAWLAGTLPPLWLLLAQGCLLWRAGASRWLARAGAVLIVPLTLVMNFWLWPAHHWYSAPDDDALARQIRDEWRLTQEVMEAQTEALSQGLASLGRQRPGQIDLYVLTFAPHAGQDVFKRESELVAEVMQQRFDAEGRSLQLVNHRDTATQRPWATPANLRRALMRVGELMDREEDVLFLHLTSHGARDGELSANFWPMHVDPVTPALLKQWLEEAGIRHRIVSVSSCYSGTWIEPLAHADALVMTASDAEHTSYGCGRRSPLTFFGRAMYDEALRETRSFEAAHAKARTVIEQRELEAGKKDGYSNPQLSMGAGMRVRLRALEAQRARAP